MPPLRLLPRAARAFSTTTPRPLARMQIIGRLAEQAEVTPTSTGRKITKFALGVKGYSKDENGNKPTIWYRVASFLPEGAQRDLLLSQPKGTQLFVDADAELQTYEGQDGTKRTNLNLRMRAFEALSRPQQSSYETTGAESETSAAEEPLSGLGAS